MRAYLPRGLRLAGGVKADDVDLVVGRNYRHAQRVPRGTIPTVRIRLIYKQTKLSHFTFQMTSLSVGDSRMTPVCGELLISPESAIRHTHAQREACEAFIKSQAGEGWRLVKTAYDDGGLSGGTMERPALQRRSAIKIPCSVE